MANVGANKFGLDAELFTRGTGERDRGESMVQKHLEKLQQDKENIAMQKLEALMPQMGPAVRVLALKECVFDVETALNLLRSFQSANDDLLKAVHKKRKKVKEAEVEAVQKAEEEAAQQAEEAASSSESGSDDSSSDSGSSSDSERDRKRRRKDKASKRSRSRKGKEKDSKRKHKRSSKDSKKKRSKKSRSEAKPKSLTAGEQYGRFGILRETDAHAKRSEFTLWAMEVKHVDVELLGRPEERELFRDYMEDYNTGTLPHRKYYNLEIYAREKAAKHAAKHGKKPAAAKPTALADEEALRKEREEAAAKRAEERLQAAYAELQATDKARDMREQEMLRMQMQAAYKTGDVRTAQQLFERLMPDEEKEAKGLGKSKIK